MLAIGNLFTNCVFTFQELLYAKCISEDEYHASTRPLLQRLALQGGEIGARDVIVGAHKEISSEELSVVDVKEDKSIDGSTTKKIKGAPSIVDFVSQDKNGTLKDGKDASASSNNNVKPRDQNVNTVSFPGNELVCSTENPFWNCRLNEKKSESKSILMMESVVEAPVLPEKQSGSEKAKKKPFRALFQRDQKEGHGGRGNERGPALEDKENVKIVKKTWGFDGFKIWKKNDPEDETAPLSVNEKSDDVSYTGEIVANPVGKGSDNKQVRNKLHPNCKPSEFFVDKVQ